MTDPFRVLLAEWERGITALQEAAEQEAVPATRERLYVQADIYERCVLDLRGAMHGPGPGGT